MHSRHATDGRKLLKALSARMQSPSPIRPAVAILAFVAAVAVAPAQVSLSTAVDLALRSSPRVLSAQDDVKKASDQLSEAHDAYIPSLTVGAALGQAYGYSPYPPTLATMSSSSLVYNAAQRYYTRSAHAGFDAAELSLKDASEAVAQDTALAFLALAHDQQREQAVQQQNEDAAKLVAIVQDRVDAGQDTQIDLTQANLTAAQFRFATLKAQDDGDTDRQTLARFTGLPSASLSADDNFPASPVAPETAGNSTPGGYANAAIASMFANAQARQQQAAGDAKFRYWPQMNMVAAYNRYATFTNSFTQLKNQQPNLTANDTAFGVQISIPLFDKVRSAKARESSDEAARALHDAQTAQIDALNGQTRIRHTVSELQAQAEVASLQQQLAQQQLDVIQLQLQSGNPNGPQMTPKDEQNARIAERDKYLAVVDASFQLRQAEIQLLRQSGQLIDWLQSTAAASAPKSQSPVPANPTPQH